MPSARPRPFGPCSARCVRKRVPLQPLRPLHATRNVSRLKKRLLPRRPSAPPSRKPHAWRPKKQQPRLARPRKRPMPRQQHVAVPRLRWLRSTVCWKPAGVRPRPRRRLLRLPSRQPLPVRPRIVVVARCIVRRVSRPHLHRSRTPVVAATSTSSPRSSRRPGRMTLPASGVRPRAGAMTATRVVPARAGARAARVAATTAMHAGAALLRRSSPRRRSCAKCMCPRPSRWPIWPTRWR